MKNTTVVRLYALAFMAVCAIVAYTSFTTPVRTERPPMQERFYSLVPEALAGPPPTAAPVESGKPLAYLRIPRFGDQWVWVVSEGTDEATLANGPGHFPGTALPGEQGNSAYAAHRSGHGDPFLDFEDLRPGDHVVIAQSGAEWTYEVLFEPRLIDDDDMWVVQQQAPGGHTWARPRVTLVTCWPKYGSTRRVFVRAALVEAGV